jgi:murein tripeptide amidase MpaA
VTQSPLSITCDFDSGNIVVLHASNPRNVQLAIRPDTRSPHFQWFHFKVDGMQVGQLQPRLDRLQRSSVL